jgi:Ca-activated chloride channel family protein
MNHIYSEHEKYAILEVEIPPQKIDKVRELALVRLSYEDMKTNERTKSSDSVHVHFSDSEDKVKSSLNKPVYADVVEQIAIETSEKALALRDQGQVQQARQMLIGNSTYLRSNAAALGSDKLESYAVENGKDADAVEQGDWTVQRKSMRESQTTRRSQR